MSKLTKIVATIGPATNTTEMIEKMAEQGVNVIRFNFSHESHENHKAIMDRVKEVNERLNTNLAIMLDTKGPEIRLGVFENGMEMYNKGDIVKVCKKEILGTKEMFHIQCPELFDDIKEGNYILIDDGKQKITVLENDGEVLTCRVEITGPIKTRKGCNVPNVRLSMPFLSEKDKSDILFGAENDVDIIAASFVRRKDDVQAIRDLLATKGREDIKICAKIENQEGFDNLADILEVADLVMVARGDLGVEVETQFVPIYQKNIIKIANKLGKPVITATHMLDSMTGNPRPTRAEASDVANAVLDGTDAVMLSGETAAGEYPLESINVMATICEAAEQIIPYREKLEYSKKSSEESVQDAIGIAIADATLTLDIAAIVVFTQGGTTARRISKFRPSVPVLAVTFNKSVQRKLQACWGVKPIYSEVQNEMVNDDELASNFAKANGFKPGQLIIISAGYPTGEGSANMMKIVEIK